MSVAFRAALDTAGGDDERIAQALNVLQEGTFLMSLITNCISTSVFGVYTW